MKKLFRYFKRKRILLNKGGYITMSNLIANSHCTVTVRKKRLFNMSDMEFEELLSDW